MTVAGGLGLDVVARMYDGSMRSARAALGPLVLALALAAGCPEAHTIAIDAGPQPDSGVATCDDETLAPYDGPTCSEAVNACRDACADETCREACLDAPCHACRYQTLFRCANAAGCDGLWHAFGCCVEGVPMCSELRGFARSGCAPSCPMQFDAYARCIEQRGGVPCFMEAAATCHLR